MRYEIQQLEEMVHKQREELEEMISEQRHAVDSLGMVNFDHYLRFKANAVKGMMAHGDPFIVNLGETLHVANLKDSIKIIHVWRNICFQCEMMHRAQQAKNKSEETEKNQ